MLHWHGTVSYTHLDVYKRQDHADVLDRALLLFPGRALVDSETELERDEIEEIAERYGAIVF